METIAQYIYITAIFIVIGFIGLAISSAIKVPRRINQLETKISRLERRVSDLENKEDE